MRSVLAIPMLLSLAFMATAADFKSAQAQLEATHPGLKWKASLVGDFNCDSIADQAYAAQSREHFYVAVALSPESNAPKLSVLRLQLKGNSQDSLCGQPPFPLELESMDYDPTQAIGSLPSGFRQSATCSGIRLIPGECDSFHIYWSFESNELDWWRL